LFATQIARPNMKSLWLIPLVVALVLGTAAAALTVFGVSVNPMEPLAAGVIATAAGVLGLTPILRSARKDPVAIFQAALIGTVVHLVSASIFTGVLLGLHVVQTHAAFVFWLLAGYWASLITLILQLRRVMAASICIPKVQQ
jgi:hypothetical protein